MKQIALPMVTAFLAFALTTANPPTASPSGPLSQTRDIQAGIATNAVAPAGFKRHRYRKRRYHGRHSGRKHFSRRYRGPRFYYGRSYYGPRYHGHPGFGGLRRGHK